jgi:sulfite exporter TauE/SafE
VTNPYEPPGTTDAFEPPTRGSRVQSLGNKSVIFGILGLLCCGLIFGPLAINYANQAEAAIILDESGATHSGTYKVGRALGYAAIGLWVLGVVVRIIGALSR